MILEKLRYHVWTAFGEMDDIDASKIKQWKWPYCKIFGHAPFDFEVGEHWASSMHTVVDCIPVCSRCGRWL